MNKDTAQGVWYKIYPDWAFFNEIIARNAELTKCVQDRVLPERDYKAVFSKSGEMTTKSDWQCRYCNWAKICYNENGGLSDREAEMLKLFGGLE